MTQTTIQPAPARITLNGVEITGTLHQLTSGRVIFSADAGTPAELAIIGPAEIFETKGGETSASAQTR